MVLLVQITKEQLMYIYFSILRPNDGLHLESAAAGDAVQSMNRLHLHDQYMALSFLTHYEPSVPLWYAIQEL